MGAVSLLIDAPFWRAGESKRDFDPTVTHPEIDRDIYIQTVIDLRRGVDVLLSRRDLTESELLSLATALAHTRASYWRA